MNHIKYKIPALLWAILLFLLSSLPGSSVPSIGFDYEDKIAHFVVYGIFGYFLAMAFARRENPGDFRRILIGLLLGLLYALSDEFHQSFVPGRFPSVSDLIADCVGLLSGGWVFRMLPFLSKRESPEVSP